MRLGIDLGGTKIEGIVLDGSREVARLRLPTPRDDYAATLAAIAGLVAGLEQVAGTAASIGLGIPGTISPSTGLVKNANSVWLIGRPLLDDVQRVLGREIRIANDANCFAVSEAADGAGRGCPVVVGVIVGSGTGAGVVVAGQVLTGPHGIAGEWGHNPLPWPAADEWPGPPCYCGKTGCIETFLSGPGLAADFARVTADPVLGTVPAIGVGQDLHPVGRPRASPEEIVARAEAGDAQAAAALDRYERRMARALASVINVLDPSVIVLGGGMSNVARLYANVPRLLGDYVFACGPGEQVRTPIVPARHGDASGVRGAAWLWG
jgi:fructokinase